MHALVHLMHGAIRPFVLAGVAPCRSCPHVDNPSTPRSRRTRKSTTTPGSASVRGPNSLDLRLDGGWYSAEQRRTTPFPRTWSCWRVPRSASAAASRQRAAAPDAAGQGHDRDDIPDNVDKCPNEPEARGRLQDTDGCPDPDNDGDGIAVGWTSAPTSRDQERHRRRDGCPEEDPTVTAS